jgi:hypothetical protein
MRFHGAGGGLALTGMCERYQGARQRLDDEQYRGELRGAAPVGRPDRPHAGTATAAAARP